MTDSFLQAKQEKREREVEKDAAARSAGLLEKNEVLRKENKELFARVGHGSCVLLSGPCRVAEGSGRD